MPLLVELSWRTRVSITALLDCSRSGVIPFGWNLHWWFLKATFPQGQWFCSYTLFPSLIGTPELWHIAWIQSYTNYMFMWWNVTKSERIRAELHDEWENGLDSVHARSGHWLPHTAVAGMHRDGQEAHMLLVKAPLSPLGAQLWNLRSKLLLTLTRAGRSS